MGMETIQWILGIFARVAPRRDVSYPQAAVDRGGVIHRAVDKSVDKVLTLASERAFGLWIKC